MPRTSVNPILLVAILALSAPAVATEATPPAERPLPATLSLEEALRIARERAPDRAIADAAVATARSQIRTAGALPNPTAGFMAGGAWPSTPPSRHSGAPRRRSSTRRGTSTSWSSSSS